MIRTISRWFLTRRWTLATLALSLLCSVTALAAEKAGDSAAGAGFDGVWQTTLSCANANGALGYSFRFPSVIKNGQLHGEKGTAGEAGWLKIDGAVGADGMADLYVEGLVGAAPYAVGQRPAGTAYGYHVAATFSHDHAEGHRVEGRPCTVLWTRDVTAVPPQAAAAPTPTTGVSPAAPGAGAADFVIQNQYMLGDAGGWDNLTLDAAGKRLFIARSDRVLVVNPYDGSTIATIPDTPGVHGIALAPALGKGFTSNGRADSVTVFDLASLLPTGTIAVEGHNPDAILYDDVGRRLYTFNGRSRDISVIDPLQATVVARIPAGGKPEFAVSDGAGRIFYNIEDTSHIGVIDSSTHAPIAAWALPDCESPTGLALDTRHGRLFSVCANGVLVVTDAGTGKHISQMPIGKGPDAAAFDAARGLIFSSNGGDGTLTVIHEDDPDHYAVIATVATQRSARTMALDPTTRRIYLVAAKFGPPPAPSADAAPARPPILEGSFTLLVVGH